MKNYIGRDRDEQCSFQKEKKNMVLTAFCYYFLGLPHFMKGVFKQKAHFWPLVIWTHLTAEPFMSLLFKCHKQPKDQCQLLASLQRTNKPVCAGTYFNSQWFCWRPNLVFIIVSKQLVECLKLLNNYQVINFNLCKLWSEASAVISFWCKLAILAWEHTIPRWLSWSTLYLIKSVWYGVMTIS